MAMGPADDPGEAEDLACACARGENLRVRREPREQRDITSVARFHSSAASISPSTLSSSSAAATGF